MQEKTRSKKIRNVITLIFAVCMVVCAMFLVGARLAGYQVYTVISGSMKPEYNVGDLIYVKKIDTSEIEVGMPITFVLNEDLVVATHRVVEIDTENQHFYTKGDANDTVDTAPVHFKNVIGVPKFRIPYLGYVSDFIQNPPGTYITIGVVGILLLGAFWPDKSIRKKDEEESA